MSWWSAPPGTVSSVSTGLPFSVCSSAPGMGPGLKCSHTTFPFGSSLASRGIVPVAECIHNTGTPLLSKDATYGRESPGGGGAKLRLGATIYHWACVGPSRVAVNVGKSEGRQRMKYLLVTPDSITEMVKL